MCQTAFLNLYQLSGSVRLKHAKHNYAHLIYITNYRALKSIRTLNTFIQPLLMVPGKSQPITIQSCSPFELVCGKKQPVMPHSTPAVNF